MMGASKMTPKPDIDPHSYCRNFTAPYSPPTDEEMERLRANPDFAELEKALTAFEALCLDEDEDGADD